MVYFMHLMANGDLDLYITLLLPVMDNAANKGSS